ncbi:MAG TPA: ATP-binding protein [Saprospiraceae bacterium]|nr:ATP-binding protein [Saprospiraceae bacterium]
MRKFVITGPESSGKSTLAAALARALRTGWVPEFARPFLQHLGRPYRHADLLAIAAGQAAWEDWYSERIAAQTDQCSTPHVICDTDWTVIRIWDRYGFEQEPPLTLPRSATPPTAYLLCSPDIPWQPDPLREHPQEREKLFDLYERLLRDTGLPYAVLSGDEEKRLVAALSFIRRFC